MNTVVANAVSRSSLVASSSLSLRQRYCISNSMYSASSVVRMPKHLCNAEMRKARFQCCAAVQSRRVSTTDLDVSPTTSSAIQDAERCAEEGIRCYHTEDGEITCEGFDEGPHFHPAARAQQMSVMKNAKCVSLLTRGESPANAPEVAPSNIVQVEERGECYCEGKDES